MIEGAIFSRVSILTLVSLQQNRELGYLEFRQICRSQKCAFLSRHSIQPGPVEENAGIRYGSVFSLMQRDSYIVCVAKVVYPNERK